MKLASLFGMTLLSYSTLSIAMFCPNNLNQIQIGDSIQQVESQCGKPPSQKTYKKASTAPQEWNYFLKINPQDQGTIKVTFSFVNNQAINISANGIGVGATAICGSNVVLGANMQTVEAACGKPVSISQLNNVPGQESTPAPDISEWKFDGPTPNTLVFENGVLTERK